MDINDIKKLENLYKTVEEENLENEYISFGNNERPKEVDTKLKIWGKVSYPKNIAAFFVFIDEMDDKGLVVITQQELANRLNCSRVSVNSYLNMLKKFGYIKQDENRLGRYYVTVDGLLALGPDRKLALLMDNLEVCNSKGDDKYDSKDLEFQFDYRLYKVMLSQGYVWKEFEEKYKDILNRTAKLLPLMTKAIVNNTEEKLKQSVEKPLNNIEQQKLENIKKYSDWANDNYVNAVIANEVAVYCTECGRKLRNTWKYCKYCGTKVEEEIPNLNDGNWGNLVRDKIDLSIYCSEVIGVIL